ncbi:hypothetical protein AU252_01035 [Pseudarthrobacter sulfonivorans]|uniref:Uncharacterized protein n=1 Tax=Pseudarthrobacter sulfonivorans TaxID=121292 RepID=A0A0U3NSW2_9MICC|nr:hypothetical protein AU252_01035 [Pseudarthrobacter sulfonivorans]
MIPPITAGGTGQGLITVVYPLAAMAAAIGVVGETARIWMWSPVIEVFAASDRTVAVLRP